MSSGGAATAAAAAHIAQAIKASGVIVKVSAENFQSILGMRKMLWLYAEGGFLSKNYQYLLSYKGIAFFTKSSDPIALPADVETVIAKQIWIP